MLKTGATIEQALSSRVLAALMPFAAALSVALYGGAAAPAAGANVAESERVQVIVELSGAPARSAQAAGRSGAIRSIAAAHRSLEAQMRDTIPEARVRWRYRRVLNGLAVLVPRGSVGALARLPGVLRVTDSVPYRASLDASPALIGAPSAWRPGLANRGEGLKIGIIDDGIDFRSPMFDPGAFTMPAGFPRGDTRFTSAKVIVARVFAPAPLPVPAASLPFDRKRSQHATHVAGIAAGNAGVLPGELGGRPLLPLSGVAPRAYLGNYRALTFPTESNLGLNGNSPEIVAAIEAAVADEMDVINLSLGQPEVAPRRDLVARALDNAAAAGVVVVVAAGNDFVELGAGSISSPGTAADAITVGATGSARAYGVRASLLNAPGGAVAGSARVGSIEGSGADQLGRASLEPLAPETLGTDATLCTGPAETRPIEPSSLALAAAGSCTLRLKAKNAAAHGAGALIVASDDSSTYRSRVKRSAIPVLVATTADVEAIAMLERSAADPRVELSSEAVVVATTDRPRIASFSAMGPSPLSKRLKPDVVAPGVTVYSAFPVRDGSFGLFSGTSMATPHVAGGAALLKELHPDWTPAQIKSALMLTGGDVRSASAAGAASPARAGAGLVDLVRAATPLIHAAPSSVSFGLARAQATATKHLRSVALSDAGGGAGTWTVSLVESRTTPGARVQLPATVDVPGALSIMLRVGRAAQEGDVSGWVVLERAGETRRLPYWARVTRPRLPRAPARALRKTGTYAANTRTAPAVVDGYRYPERPSAGLFRGPESVFSVRIDRPIVNFGVAVVKQQADVSVEPRIVFGRDENALAGASALPFNGNPYQLGFGDRRLIAGVLRPTPGRYTVVFDTRTRRTAGPFRFRFWINDTRAPTIRVEGRRTRDGAITATVRDHGSGVDPASLSFNVDGGPWIPAEWHRPSRRMIVDLFGLRPGRYTIGFRAADRQETKNWEYSNTVLPNTRVVKKRIAVVRDG
jgi:subtilisin family serine protease